MYTYISTFIISLFLHCNNFITTASRMTCLLCSFMRNYKYYKNVMRNYKYHKNERLKYFCLKSRHLKM